jgi:hypothetical protein
VLITPLINLGSSQIEYQRAARGLGIPCALCVWSWDHLSSKALIRDWPDRVFVWNDVQRQEALNLHGVPADRIVVTGAQCFDQWFNRQPSRTRAEFCAHVGLPDDRPFVMYACSTLSITARRRPSWSSSGFARCAPAGFRICRTSASWCGRTRRGFSSGTTSTSPRWGRPVLWGRNPLDPVSKADYFDSMYHSAAVVGLITSAFIEAGIVGREVHTVLDPEFEDNQLGTVHYHYLTNTAGGLLIVGKGWDEHLQKLNETLSRTRQDVVKPFIMAFVRPPWPRRRATPRFVEQVEAMKALTVQPVMPETFGFVWRWAIDRLRAMRHTERYDRWILSEREQTVKRRNQDISSAGRASGAPRARRSRPRSRSRSRSRRLSQTESEHRVPGDDAHVLLAVHGIGDRSGRN